MCSSPRGWVLPAAELSVGFLAQKLQAGLHKSTLEFYSELLLCRVEEEAHARSPGSLLSWLDRGSLVAKKRSLRGISGLVLGSDLEPFFLFWKEDPWSIQLVVLSTLGSMSPEELNRAMERIETILPTLGSREKEAAFLRKLAASYCALMDQEVVAVTVAAISHLGHLRSRSTVPPTAEEAIVELVNVFIRLGDHPVVAL
ncbi:hypothetical protein lerEdw1_013255, partial [Lerista edwardsae]